MARAKGQTQAVSNKQRREAAAAGVLPHEWLLAVMRSTAPFKQRVAQIVYDKDTGVEVSRQWVERDYWPTWEERMDAAKAAANYYAPKLAVHMLPNSPQAGAEAIHEAMKLLAARLPV